VKDFSEAIRSGEKKGYSGRKLMNTVVIGIGGSYLGPQFVNEAI